MNEAEGQKWNALVEERDRLADTLAAAALRINQELEWTDFQENTCTVGNGGGPCGDHDVKRRALKFALAALDPKP